MKRVLFTAGILAVALVACDVDPLGPTKGSMTITLDIPDDYPGAATAPAPVDGGTEAVNAERRPDAPDGAEEQDVDRPARSPAAPLGHLDAIRVTVSGPTTKTETFTCTATMCSGTVTDLDPGSYAVVVAGLVGTAVDHFGQATGVNVTAGSNASATITFQSFQPVLNAFAQDTVEVLRFTASWSSVPAASSYVLEYSQAADFSGATTVNVSSGTSTEIVVSQEAEYFVRVRAVNPAVPNAGRTSAPRSIVALQGVATVTVTPPTPTIAGGTSIQLAAEGRDGDGNVVFGIDFFWSSNKPLVANVDQTGLVTGRFLGTAIITAVGKGQPGSTNITVTFGSAADLYMVDVDDAEPDGPVGPVEVHILDDQGHLVENATDNVTIALIGSPAGGSLAGTLTQAAVGGIATFDDLSIDVAGDGYVLEASAAGLNSSASDPFDVFLEFVQVSAGDESPTKCGVTDRGSAYCWGYNDAGLGDGNTFAGPVSIPVRVVGGLTFRSVSVGGAFSVQSFACGLTTDGEAYCWGDNGVGQLGDGNVPTDSPTPSLVSGGYEFASVSAGVSHACGVLVDGTAVCWGAGANGRLGNNGTTNQPTPVAVSGGDTYMMIDAGGSHTCAIRSTDNEVMCWGFGNNGQLGTGGTIGAIADLLVPTATLGGPSVYVSASAGHSCEIKTSGYAYCWGDNNVGQLGNNSTTSSSSPVGVAGGIRFVSIHASASTINGTTCGLTSGGAGMCWGSGTWGALANGAEANSSVPVQVVGGPWIALDSGRRNGIAVAAHGTFTWGNGANGERGDGTFDTVSSTAVRVVGSR